jgi:UDP:flavonoid glycosyltransferase YjiC (YdhE family)
MRIVLAADGSRGDLQPMVELAAAVAEAGHEVKLCGPPDFAEAAAARGLAFASVGISFRGLLEERAEMMDKGAFNALAEALSYLREHLAGRLVRLVELTRGADLVVAAGAEFAAASAAEHNRVPYRYVVYCPALLRSREHAPAFVPWQALPAALNRAVWPLLMTPIAFFVGRVLAPARRAVGLGAGRRDWYRHLLGDRPLLAADRPLASVPADVGFPVDQTPALHPWRDAPLPEKLASFLAAGPPPVYVGFGSMPDAKPDATTRTLLDAIARVGCRAVIGAGWAGLGRGALPSDVFVAGAVSHPALFARCAAVVHHGGAGTTTTAARAGAPQVLVPHVVDQFYWARRIHALGVSPPAIPRRKLTADALAASLEAVLGNELLAVRARELADRLAGDLAEARPVAALLRGI